MYTHEQALAASTAYFSGDTLAADVFVTKYAIPADADGHVMELTPDDMHRRLAREFARIEQRYRSPVSEDVIYELLRGFERVIPQGSPMAAIGNYKQIQSLSNCFVVDPPQDSYGGIFRADEEIAQIMKRRGGVGLDVSPIRPRGMPTRNAARTTDGIAVFMERFSNTCREVAQDGRRGALMLTCSVHHPDVMTFIRLKRDLRKVTGANVSLRISDEFMRAVVADTTYEQRWPVDAPDPTVRTLVRARDVWSEIVNAAHACAEPGMLFWDTIIRNTPADAYAEFRSSSTNPCSELPLPPYDSCRLILVRLLPHVIDPFTSNARFDFASLDRDAYLAQRLMDDLVDLEIEAVDRIIVKVESDPEDERVRLRELDLWRRIRYMAHAGRRTGLGATGLGDVIAMLGMRYGSPESVELTERIYKTLSTAAWRSSIDMAQERGAFPAYDEITERGHVFITKMLDAVGPEHASLHARCGRRNIALTMSSPAGSTSIVGRCANAIEPVYLESYTRRRKLTADDGDVQPDFVDASGDRWKEYTVEHPGIALWRRATGNLTSGSTPYHGSLAADIDSLESIAVQAAAQRWICHGISKTVNMPSTVTADDVERVFIEAWRAGCKGITIYRDGSRVGVLVADASAGKKQKQHAAERPKVLPCDVHRVSVRGEPYLVLVGLLDGAPYEVFAGEQGKIDLPRSYAHGTITRAKRIDGRMTYDLTAHRADGVEPRTFHDIVTMFDNQNYGAMTRTISMILRCGCSALELIETLRKDKYSDISSFSSGIARVIKQYVKDGTKLDAKCPDCDQPALAYQGGCVTCTNCSYSKCA